MAEYFVVKVEYALPVAVDPTVISSLGLNVDFNGPADIVEC